MAVLRAITSLFTLILTGLRLTATTLFTLPFRIQFMLFWLLGVLFLLFNGPAVYGPDFNHWQIALLLYISSLAFVFSQTRQPNPLLGVSTAEFLITFVLSALMGVLLFKFLQPFNPDVATLSTESIAILGTHIMVVAIGEELLFRHAIPSMIPGPRIAAMTLSAIAFGGFHYAAYGGSVPNMLFAAGLGLFFGAVTIRFRNGLIIAMALHATWNAYTLGFI